MRNKRARFLRTGLLKSEFREFFATNRLMFRSMAISFR